MTDTMGANSSETGKQSFRAFVESAAPKIAEIWNPTGQALAAEFWVSKSQKKTDGTPKRGFSPKCGIKFNREAGCKLGQGGKCADCGIHVPVYLTPDVLKLHLWGKKSSHRCGVYPMLPGNLTAWVATDLDNHDGQRDPAADTQRLTEVCKVLDVPQVIFNSNSATGFHPYIFFQEPIPAAKARALMLALLDRAGIDISHTKDKEGSFDCVFPKQNRLKPDDIGNLIAVPFSGEATRSRSATMMLDPETLQPAGASMEDNFELFLEVLNPMAESDVDALLNEMEVQIRDGSTCANHFTGAKAQANLPEIVEKCAFLRHCRDHAHMLSEPEWYLMVCVLAREFGGPALVHKISRPYPAYSPDETQDKINHALMDQPGPITCRKIKEGFDCGQDCGVTCPVHLIRPKAAREFDVEAEEAEALLEKYLQEAEEGNPEAPFDAAPYLAALPKREDMKWRQRFKAALKGKLNLNHLGESVNEVRKEKRRSIRSLQTSAGDLPTINTDAGQLPQITEQALAALYGINDPAPTIFCRSGSLVRIRVDEKGQPTIEPLSEAALRGQLARAARWERNTQEGTADVNPPIVVVQDILSLPAWGFPPIEAIVQTPTIRPDGSILDAVGYDPAMKLFYLKDEGFSLPHLPEHPTKEDAIAAANFIFTEVLWDFPFMDQASRANAFALILTSLLRQSLLPKSPLGVIDAPQQGTGKSLLAESVSAITTGCPAAMTTAPDSSRYSDDDEWRKRITAMLRAGINNVIIDNVEGRFNSPSLAAVLTMTTWSDRVLGRNEQITLPQKSAWIATGNNIKPTGDLPRRCYWIRLDAQMARPFLRSGFRHSDLLSWIRENRGEIVAALLCMTKAWFVEGKPKPAVQDVGSFEVWTRTIGGILEYAGIEGFLANAAEFYEADDELKEWEAFVESWYSLYGSTGVTIAKIASDLSGHNQNKPTDILERESALKVALPGELAETFDRSAGSFKKSLGRQLARRTGVHFTNGFKMVCKKDTHSKAMLWRVVKMEAASCGVSLKNGQQNSACQVIDFPGVAELAEFGALTGASSETYPPFEGSIEKGIGYLKGESGKEEIPQTPHNSAKQQTSDITASYTQSIDLSIFTKITCSDCRRFDGRWCKAERSWNGARGQEATTEHPCNSFEPKVNERAAR